MQLTSFSLLSSDSIPNVELLRRQGWTVENTTGPYCVAWRGRDEIVVEWIAGSWHYIGGRGVVNQD